MNFSVSRWHDISTHTLRKEGDVIFTNIINFFVSISTHTLRKEGDPPCETILSRSYYFNPHPPQGG